MDTKKKNMEGNNDIWTRSARYLSGEMNDREKASFLKDLDEDTFKKEEFEKMKRTWEKLENDPQRNYANTQPHWKNLKDRIEKDGLLQQPVKERSIYFHALKIAAGILIIAALGISSFLIFSDAGKNQPKDITYAAIENSKTYDLPDGSRILLNKGSEIVLQSVFNFNRNLTLKGEAYFEVMADPSLPFSIHTNTADITVLGTSFNVRETKNETEVYVESGSVKLEPEDKTKEIILKKGDFAVSTRKNALITNLEDLNYLSWKTKKFRFDNYELTKIFEILEKSYHAEINYTTDDIKNLRLSSEYEQQTLESIIRTICIAFDLDYSFEKDKYTIQTK